MHPQRVESVLDEQLGLFEQARRRAPPAPPRFELPDDLDHQSHSGSIRETSRATWDQIRDRLSPARRAVIEVLLDGRPRTASEIGAADAATGRCFWKRASELVEMGFLREGAARVCAVTGQTCVTYEIARETTSVEREAPPPIPSRAELLQALDEIRRAIPTPSGALSKVEAWLQRRAKRGAP